MKKLLKFGCLGTIGLVILLGILVAVTPSPESTATAEPAAENLAVLAVTPTPEPLPEAVLEPTAIPTLPTVKWYSGGTLHSSTLAEWKTGTPADKLATASDWYVTGRSLKNLQPDDEPILRAAAELMILCIDELIPVVTESYGETAKTNAPALMCAAHIAEEMPEVKALER